MISQAMKLLTGLVQEALHTTHPGTRPPVRLGRLSETETRDDTGLVLSLVNLGVDPTVLSGNARQGGLPGLRLTVLIAAGRGNGYAESLDLLSSALRHLHARPLLTPAECPAMDGAFERLNIVPLSLDLERLRGLWSLQGAPYCPSLAYEILVQPAAPADGVRKVMQRASERDMVAPE